MGTSIVNMKILVILGPTATGKTDLALFLAKKFNGELVSCDSRQVYIGLDIGTGKMPSEKFKVQSEKLKKESRWWEIDGVKIWMYDVVDPKKQYTVANYVKDADKVIKKICANGKLPIVVGGTGLYLKALLEGLPNLIVPLDLKLRKELEKLPLGELQKRLQKISTKKWKDMNNSDRQNPRRLIRAIEIVILSKTHFDSSSKTKRAADILKIGLTAAREILYQRIDERVIKRIDQGMITEAKSLHTKGLILKRMRSLGLEYRVLADYLEGEIGNIKELIKILQGKIHHYAKRQITWFKKEKGVNWFDITDENYPVKVENLITKWYDLSYA
ncbi:tRNA (adenosine(37)-N6)-dimethylallyltransferase MiaA [Candidatus Daviesbacteria bacterium]|nr:tRNA (adenosine(37)-N6)-dimethylallyltransferase MiaA [Candidatus Daviesbacteria bacterium]